MLLHEYPNVIRGTHREEKDIEECNRCRPVGQAEASGSQEVSLHRGPRATKKGRICSLTASHLQACLQEATTTKGEKKQNAHECKKSTLLKITIQRFKGDQDKE